MKAVYCEYGEPPRLIDMESTPLAYVGGGDGFGYRVVDSQDFCTDCEWFSLHIAMSLYEGAEIAGSYDSWSWAIIPENNDEAKHLDQITNRNVFFRTGE